MPSPRHALAWTLTKRHDAALVCGLAFGFNPYRVAHLEHLELLMAFGMPAALAALHLNADTRRVRWLVAFSAALTLQALSASYYALFFTLLLGMWMLWFLRPRAWRDGLAIVAAGYEPLYYRVLKHALADHDRTALEALAAFGPLLIAAGPSPTLSSRLSGELGKSNHAYRQHRML